METNTCQICERVIKAKTGLIAHHGYQRPDRGSGWQTASCWGARSLPYEKSCNQIQPCIDHITMYVANQKKMVKDLMENPPEELSEIGMYRTPRIFKRPEGFDAKANMDRGSWSGGMAYEYQHYSDVRLHERQILQGNRDIKRLEQRLANWKPV